jgi:hypothetical protein
MNKMTVGGDLWTPPMLGMPWLVANLTPVLIALGFLLIVHKVPEMVREALGVKPAPYGAAIGQSLTPLTTVLGLGRQGVSVEVGRRFETAGPLKTLDPNLRKSIAQNIFGYRS